MMDNNSILEKFTDTAEALTDDELDACLVYYQLLVKVLRVCPVEYRLMRNDARSKLERLQGWHKARKGK